MVVGCGRLARVEGRLALVEGRLHMPHLHSYLEDDQLLAMVVGCGRLALVEGRLHTPHLLAISQAADAVTLIME